MKKISLDTYFDIGSYKINDFDMTILSESMLSTDDGKKSFFKKVFSLATIKYNGIYYGFTKLDEKQRKYLRSLYPDKKSYPKIPFKILSKEEFNKKFYDIN